MTVKDSLNKLKKACRDKQQKQQPKPQKTKAKPEQSCIEVISTPEALQGFEARCKQVEQQRKRQELKEQRKEERQQQQQRETNQVKRKRMDFIMHEKYFLPCSCGAAPREKCAYRPPQC